MPGTWGLLMFFNLTQKGWVGEVEREGQYVTMVERQDGGAIGQWWREQAPVPDFWTKILHLLLHNLIKLFNDFMPLFSEMWNGDNIIWSMRINLLNRDNVLLEYTRYLINVIIIQLYHHSTVTSDSHVSNKWSSMSRKPNYQCADRLICPNHLYSQLILRISRQHINL